MSLLDDLHDGEIDNEQLYRSFDDRSPKTRKRLTHKKAKPSHSYSSTGAYATTGKNWLRPSLHNDSFDYKKSSRRSKTISSISREDLFAVADKSKSKLQSSKHHTMQRASARNYKREQILSSEFPDQDVVTLNKPVPLRVVPTHSDSTDQLGSSSSAATLLNNEPPFVATNAQLNTTIPARQRHPDPEPATRDEERCPPDRLEFINNLAPLLKLNLPSRLDKCRSDREYHRRSRHRSGEEVLTNLQSTNREEMLRESLWIELQYVVRGWRRDNIMRERGKSERLVDLIRDFKITTYSQTKHFGHQQNSGFCLEEVIKEASTFSNITEALQITPQYLMLLQISMEYVDKLLIRVNRFQSVFRNSRMLKATCPDFFDVDVENRLRTMYQWRSIVHQLNACVALVCSELNVDCSMIVAQLYKEHASNGSERDQKAYNRLSVIFSPYEVDLETPLYSSSDENESPYLVKSEANIDPLSTTEGGGAVSPVDSTHLFSGGPRPGSPYPFDGYKPPIRPLTLDTGVCVTSSGSSGKHRHLSNYQQNQSSCSFDHDLDISNKDDRRKICRRYAENSMVRGGVRKIMENLFHLIERIIAKSRYTLLRPVKPAACSSLSSHQSMCFAEAIRNNQSISGEHPGFIPIRGRRKSSDASNDEEDDLKIHSFAFDETLDSNKTPRINFRNWYSRTTEEPDMEHLHEAGHIGSLGWGTIPESEEEDADIQDRDDYRFGVWSKEFEDMNLPSFLPHFSFLVRVPLDTVHECIRMHLEQEVDITNNTRGTDIPLLKHVINEYKEALRCGVIVRRYYQKMLGPCLPVGASLCPGSDQRFMDDELEEFEADLNKMLQQYLICVRVLVTKMQDYQEASSLKSRVEDEWEFVKHVGSLIRDGKAEAAKQFCDLATVQLNAISENLEPNIQEITSQLFDRAAQDDDEDDVPKDNDTASSGASGGYKYMNTSCGLGSPPDSCKFSPGTSISSSGKEKRRAIYNAFKDIQKRFTDARISLLKAIDYAKMLSSDLEIAADLAFLPGYTSGDLLQQLAKTQHVLIVMEASHEVVPPRHGFSREEMLGTFEFDEDWSHVSSQSSSLNYGVFVPHEMISDLHAIEDLLYAVFSPRDKIDDAEFKPNYLLLVENCKEWRGKRVSIQPSVEHTVVMSHTEVKGVMLMARSGVQLAAQLKCFMDQFSNILRVECNQMACHQSIVGSMNELKECARKLGITLQSCLKEIKQSLDQHSNKLKISEKLVGCLENCFSVAFAYHRELYRIAKTPETRRQMMPTLMELFDLWDQVVRKYHERGKGKMPRWANDGCDFLLYMLTQPQGIAVISEERWAIFKKSVDALVVYIVGEPPSSYHSSSNSTGCNVSSGHSSRLLPTSSNSPATVMEDEELANTEFNGTSNSIPISGAQSLAMCSRSISVHDKPILPSQLPLSGFGPSEHPAYNSYFSVPGVGNHQDSETGNRIHSKSDAAFRGYELTTEIFQDKSKEPITKLYYHQRSSMLKKLNELDEKRTKKWQELRKIGTVREKQVDLKRPDTREVPFKWHRGQLIGTGRAKVYSAIRYDTRERIAIKQVTELEKGDRKKTNDLVQETIKEYDLIAQLDHPNLLKYYGIEVSKTELILFMEYCDGGTLASLAQELLEEPFVRCITRSVLNAVDYLHNKGIVHRDIKSANIFVCNESSKDAIVKLGDFGTATQLNNPYEGTMEKEITDIIGTLIYTAPEVCRGECRGYGRACDIWSLACVVLEMITGKPPWVELAGEHQLSVMFKLGQGNHPHVPAVGGRMTEQGQAFILQCFCESAKRPTASQLLDQPFVQC